jgi:TatA/E family protein of Tat protein translocase
MRGLRMPALVVILVIAFFIFGVSRLPRFSEGPGKAIRGFKKSLADSPDEMVKRDKENKKLKDGPFA